MQGMVVLADQHGTLIHTMGHVDFLGRQTRWRCGASWHAIWRPTPLARRWQKRVGGDSRRRAF
jgi:hypothetical protein